MRKKQEQSPVVRRGRRPAFADVVLSDANTNGAGKRVRVHISALSSEQVCSSLSRIKKNGVKDEGRSDNQLRVRAQALQPERPWPLDEEVLRGGGV